MIYCIQELGNCLQKTIVRTNQKQLKFHKSIIEKYIGQDWKNYMTIDPTHYHREKVFECNNFDIYVITWDKLQKSKIHNHAQYGCLNKILLGSLQENIYNKNNLSNPLLIKQTNINDISYIDNSLGYHKIVNNNNISVSLHIYSPPKFQTKYF